MTEAEWLACRDSVAMLMFLRSQVISERKLRLFAAACCRMVYGSSADKPTRAALSIVEHLAERGELQTGQPTVVRVPAGSVVIECGASEPAGPWHTFDSKGLAKQHAESAIQPLLSRAVQSLSCTSLRNLNAYFPEHLPHILDNAGLDLTDQAVLLRDIIRGPFRPISARPAWFDWNDSVVRRIADGIYEERAFDRLPILGDALEEAGCAEQEILQHCRSEAEHVRGCWVIDWILGKP